MLSRAVSLDWTPLEHPPAGSSRRRVLEPAHLRRADPRTRRDPVSAVLVREQLDAVRTAWSTLSDNERAAMAGVLNGKSQRQIATEMACTVKAVGYSLRRARAKLAIRGC